MNSSNQQNLVICSAMVAPARLLIFYKLRTWIDQVVKVVVHTFAVEMSKLPLSPDQPDGYWYCAGDFCDIDEAGVYQHLSKASLEFARCLVVPNIKDDHPDREKLVITGEYGVHYVCHNITNRILYATEAQETLVDLDLKTTGYELVVKSTLGIYGQNKVEWEQRKQGCVECKPSDLSDDLGSWPTRSRDEEIHRIHLRAAGGNIEKASNITNALSDVDHKFLLETKEFVDEFDGGVIDIGEFEIKMVAACAELFSATIGTVGEKMTERIYPGCNIHISLLEEVAHAEPSFQVMKS